MSAITNHAVSSKSGGLESVKFYVFDREDDDIWNKCSIKKLVFVETKGWVEGLTDSTATEDKKKKAKSYLTMSLTGKAFKFLNCLKNPKNILEALEEEYASMEEDDRCELEEEFKRFMMEDTYGNPTNWFNRLYEINTKLSNIDGGKYVKTEDDIKLQIRMNLPEEVYSKVITSFKDYSNMNVKKVKKEIKQFHHQLKRNDKIKESKEESIMQVNNKFKGKCYNYGEPGHQTSECTKPKKKNNGRQQRRNMKCYICGGNHYTIDCPQKKQNLEQAHMFVGVIRVIREKTIREKIEDMMEINKPRLVSTILGNMNTNQLFEPKGNKMINPQVSMTANQLLSNWLGQDNNILEIQYNNYMEKRMKGNTNKENINTPAETNMEIKENGWTKIKCKD